jgi:hypothetical protein
VVGGESHTVTAGTGRTAEKEIWHAFTVDFSGESPTFIAVNAWVEKATE